MEQKTLQTPLLEISYLEDGPADGKPIILLHGWPYDAHTWDAVTGPLAAQGWHTYAPYLRGFGPTRFLDDGTRRSGQITAIAQDAKDFADALKLEEFTLVGHDWGGRAGYLFAANWPERLERLVAVAVPYGGSPNQMLSPAQRKAYWYQWFFGTEQAQYVLEEDRDSICRYLWETWGPAHFFDEAAFASASEAWQNPDWVKITLHSYRARWGRALPDPRYEALEAAQMVPTPISVPTIVLHGAEDGASLVSSSENQDRFFTAGYARKVLPGIGHSIQLEQPDAVVRAVVEEFPRG